MDETEVGRIASWVGLDVGKEDHHATVVSAAGERLFELAVGNDEAAIERLLDRALESGPCALVIDQPGSIGSLAVCVARRRGVPVAYVPGLVMRRASELYPGEAKTDRRDSYVLADTARSHARRLHWLEVSDETLERLRLLGGYDDDLAHDVNRTANRLRDMLLAVSPALERVLGPRLDHPVARALLARYPTPTALRAAGRRRLGPLAKRHAPRMGARLVDEIQAALAAQTVTVPAEDTAGRVIRELAEELDRLADRRDRLAHEIEQTFTSHPRRRSCCRSRESGPGPAHGSSPRSVTSTDSPPPATSPPTPASPPSPANPAARSTARPAAAGATTGSRTPCGCPPSAPCTTTAHATTTPANAPKASSTTPPSPASPAAAATSSTPCSAPASATANYPGRQDRPPNRTSHSPPKHPLTNP